MCNCMRTVKTTSITEDGDILTLTIPDTELRHGQRIRVCFAQTPPVITDPLKVVVSTDGGKYYVLQNRMEGAFGAMSFMYSDQLQSCCGRIKARQYLDLVFASDTETFAYCGPCRCLSRANVAFPRVIIPTPVTAASVKSERKVDL